MSFMHFFQTDDIVSALEKLIPVNSDEKMSREKDSINEIEEPQNPSYLDHPSHSGINLMSVQPPWEASNIDLV